MSDPPLLSSLQSFVRRLEEDLRERSSSMPEIRDHVEREHTSARKAERTGESREEFQEQLFTQGAVAWVLCAVFLRFLEDNDFLDEPDGTKQRWLGGHRPDLVQVAKDTQHLYFQDHPTHGERDYLLDVYRMASGLPGLDRLFDPAHNPLWHLPTSADAARDLLDLLRKVDPTTGEPVHTFHDPDLDTRFLGDLYQDLSESARKRYALLQTPEFVEEFILDYTLDPAIDEFGYDEVRLIDPACGSGHFLLGAFHRLLARHQAETPGVNGWELAQRALDQVAGVDLNPFAVAIARFRLLIGALIAGGVSQLSTAPAFELQVAVGDSLLHGQRPGTERRSAELFELGEAGGEDFRSFSHYFDTEDQSEVRDILTGRYHVVVGNPPYIAVKDNKVNQLYRKRYDSCYMQYSLVCPFLERAFDLAIPEDWQTASGGGYVGLIVANSFTKRNFGRKLIEDVLTKWDLTHLIDTSGAYLPGHGTPTVILFARRRKPIRDAVRAVLGIKGEPRLPPEPSKGEVWTSIKELIEGRAKESAFVSVDDMPRSSFDSHPWTLTGGGISKLKLHLEREQSLLSAWIESIGFYQDTHADEAFVQPSRFFSRKDLESCCRPLVRGEGVRDWHTTHSEKILFPYNDDLSQWPEIPSSAEWAWFRCLRSMLWARSTFGGTYKSEGRPWFDWHQFPRERARRPIRITFAFVATHNHFVLSRKDKVFNRHAPIITLPEGTQPVEYLKLLGILNSSSACFWIKQVCFDRGGGGIGGGLATEEWERFYEHTATQLQEIPLPVEKPLLLTEKLDSLGKQLESLLPTDGLRHDVLTSWALPKKEEQYLVTLRQMITLQEELDWQVYRLYDLLEDDLTYDGDPPGIQLGERAFEIVMARQMAAGELVTTWFERHRSTPIIEIPEHWPEDYRQLVQRRIDTIADNKNVRLIEKPEYKRRWNIEPWEDQEKRALRRWLLDRLEADGLWSAARLTSTAHLTDEMRGDEDFQRVAALYRGHGDFDLTKLVTELVREEGVPYLAAHRYKPSGLRKRRQWERVWELQRQEDALDARTELPEDDPQHLTKEEAETRKTELDVPVPPKYKSSDFTSSTIWSHRGKLDVPKEQFILYPGAECEADPTPVLGWAGWDHLKQAEALANYYTRMRDVEGWPPERLLPLLAGLQELLPWLKQWHNERDTTLGMGMGDYYTGFTDEEARRLGVTKDDLKQWTP